jgi:hypothetical protein
MTFNTDIEKTEQEIKVLQKKLEFLQSIRDHKEQEIKEAYKVAYGRYPETGFAMSDGDVISWDAFKKGYVAGQLNDTVWKSVALRFGETLADIGPCGYHEISPDEWLKWAKETYEKLANEWVQMLNRARNELKLHKDANKIMNKAVPPDESFGKDIIGTCYDEVEWDEKDNPKTLLQIIREWCDDDNDPTCEELVNRISGWLPVSYDEPYGDYSCGWNDCLNEIKEKLK